jgi:thimet oligopeptidase
VVNDWEKEYYERIVKTSDYAFDPQSVRPYFAYESVKQGVLDLTGRLFGIEYRRVHDVELWSPDVETFDVYEKGTNLGRFHLDMHPRADKFKHAAQFTLVHGVEGRQLPEAALVCNFPRPRPEDPALLEHDDVETFLHEFGHLLHTIFAGRQRWLGVSGITTEWDFVEAPSQMLEEWARDAKVLQTFAFHHETGEKIPDELVARLRRANEFGKGSIVRQQMFYAALSLGLHDRDPQGLDTTTFVQEMQRRYSMYDYVDGTYFHLSFGHLEGYSALYYTYMWSLVIAKDLFSNFNRDNLFDPAVARAYREAVLAPGGSAPAARLVHDFLGRPFGFEAYQEWIDSD